MPAITSKKLLRFLQKKGFYITRQSGSHMILHHANDGTKRVTLPLHNKDIRAGTLSSILKQAGIERSELFTN
jgi:predicted RNA binding protein YcfA (HicA-like mRNA interferase family)